MEFVIAAAGLLLAIGMIVAAARRDAHRRAREQAGSDDPKQQG
jgi:hypothetical protein